MADDGIKGPRIWPEAPTDAAARIVDAARAPWRNLLREISGFLIGAADAGGEEGGGVDGGGVEVVDAIGFLSSMNISSVAQE